MNTVCAHPECTNPTEGKHHLFPKSQLKGAYWWVQLSGDHGQIVPNVVGLCGSGTTGHHGDIEEHRAWIKYEGGEFIWYDRVTGEEAITENHWRLLGTLNPQPGQAVGKPKRKRFKGEARRKRKTISLRVPDDTENGGELWDEILERVQERLIAEGLYSEGDSIPVYESLMAALNDWLS